MSPTRSEVPATQVHRLVVGLHRAPTNRTPIHPSSDQGTRAPTCIREPAVGTSADPRRVGPARPPDRRLDRLGDLACGGHRSSTDPRRTHQRVQLCRMTCSDDFSSGTGSADSPVRGRPHLPLVKTKEPAAPYSLLHPPVDHENDDQAEIVSRTRKARRPGLSPRISGLIQTVGTTGFEPATP